MISTHIISVFQADMNELPFIISTLNKSYPELDITITISGDVASNTYRLNISYKHPQIPNKNSYTTIDTLPQESLEYGLKRLVALHNKQIECKHDYRRPKDMYEQFLGDGRGRCRICNLENQEALSATRKVISMSLSIDDVSARFEWPSDSRLQGGDCGIVLVKEESYTTAFCEAFLSIGQYSTFLRGEGDDIISAEKACYEKYLKIASCNEHDFSRLFNNTERRDGYAKCTKCGLASKALPPLDTCSVCSKPTSTSVGELFFCQRHWLEQPLEDLVADKVNKYGGNSFLTTPTVEELRYKLYIEKEIKRFWLNEIGDTEFDLIWESLSLTVGHFSESLLRRHFGKKGIIMREKYPTPPHPKITENLKYYYENKDKILNFCKKKGKLSQHDIVK